MSTSWYYDYYESGAFPNQQTLCKAVEWTRCNLEGRLLDSTTFTQKDEDGTEKKISSPILKGMPANPLTIRLFALREALNLLEASIKPINDAFDEQWNRLSKETLKCLKWGGKLITQESNSVETHGAPVEIITINGQSKPLEWRYDTAHLALYEFFTNLGSVTDRLAYEINMLYGLNIPKVDWPKLVDLKSRYKHSAMLNNKDSTLAGYIKNSAPKFTKALAYRNRLVHDGIIRFATRYVEGLTVLLAQDPNNNQSTMDVDALDFCQQTKSETLELLNKSYEIMLQHHKNHGNPPW